MPLNASKVSTPDSPPDPFDFTDYEAAIARAHEHLRSDLAKVKAGGLDPEAIENVRVKLGKGGDGGSLRVGDVSSVVKRGRNVVVLVGEKDVCPKFNESSYEVCAQQTPHNA